jgi:hypothetical protein
MLVTEKIGILFKINIGGNKAKQVTQISYTNTENSFFT